MELAWLGVLQRSRTTFAWCRYTPYEGEPYLPALGAPPIADAVTAHAYAAPALPGQGKAAREPLELSPVPEVINTGFASIDSKQKASQRFSIPALLSQGAAPGPPPAEEPAAQAPRRKKKEEGSMPPRLKPPAGKVSGPEQSAVLSGPSLGPEASSQPPVHLSGKDEPPPGTQRPALPPGSAPASGKDSTESGNGIPPSLQLPGSQPALSVPLASPDKAAADPGSVDASPPSLQAQASSEAAPTRPYFPAFGSLIPPVPEDSAWHSAPAAAGEDGQTASNDRAGHLQDMQLHGPATDMPADGPAGDAADTDFWASAGAHAEAAMQQPGLSHLDLEETYSKEERAEHQQQQPVQDSARLDLANSDVPAGDATHHHLNDAVGTAVASFQGSSAQIDHQPGFAPGPSSDRMPSFGQHVEPDITSSGVLVTGHGEDSRAPPQRAQEQQAPTFEPASNPFGASDESHDATLDPFASSFPAGQDEDTSFFEGLGGPGNARTLSATPQLCTAALAR